MAIKFPLGRDNCAEQILKLVTFHLGDALEEEGGNIIGLCAWFFRASPHVILRIVL